MEQNPEQSPEAPRPLNVFKLEFDTGREVICHRQNTSAFIHSEEPWGDHLFIHYPPIDDEEERGDYVFREQISNFDEIVSRMIASDWAVIENERINEDDLEAYEEFKAMKQRNLEMADKIKNEITLTDRQENLANFFGYLLLHERLAIEDFHGEGNLYI